MKHKLAGLFMAGASALAITGCDNRQTPQQTAGQKQEISNTSNNGFDLTIDFPLPGGRIYTHHIDPSLLDPQTGALTTGFIYSIFKNRCGHSSHAVSGLGSTDADEVERMMQIAITHGVSEGTVRNAYSKAFEYWNWQRGQASLPTPAPADGPG